MKIYAPNYYKKFNCIASKCKHNCCIGWEIDIDDDTLLLYESISSEFSRKIRDNIVYEDGIAFFKLKEGDRCPFLNDDNLCDIIINMGDGGICDICADHPRFRNFYFDTTEIGLGLTCEEASRIILSEEEPFSVICIDEYDENDILGAVPYFDNEKNFFDIRNKCIEILTDRITPFAKRMDTFLDFCNVSPCRKILDEWLDIFTELEEMDSVRNDIYADMRNYLSNRNGEKKKESSICDIWTIPCENSELYAENLAVYFVYRHFAKYFEGINISALASFAALSCCMIISMCKAKFAKTEALNFSDIAEYARLYSSEIEYSEDNTYKLLNELLC